MDGRKEEEFAEGVSERFNDEDDLLREKNHKGVCKLVQHSGKDTEDAEG